MRKETKIFSHLFWSSSRTEQSVKLADSRHHRSGRWQWVNDTSSGVWTQASSFWITTKWCGNIASSGNLKTSSSESDASLSWTLARFQQERPLELNTDGDMLRQFADEEQNVRGRPTDVTVEVSAGWNCEKRETWIRTNAELAPTLERNGAPVGKKRTTQDVKNGRNVHRLKSLRGFSNWAWSDPPWCCLCLCCLTSSSSLRCDLRLVQLGLFGSVQAASGGASFMYNDQRGSHLEKCWIACVCVCVWVSVSTGPQECCPPG